MKNMKNNVITLKYEFHDFIATVNGLMPLNERIFLREII